VYSAVSFCIIVRIMFDNVYSHRILRPKDGMHTQRSALLKDILAEVGKEVQLESPAHFSLVLKIRGHVLCVCRKPNISKLLHLGFPPRYVVELQPLTRVSDYVTWVREHPECVPLLQELRVTYMMMASHSFSGFCNGISVEDVVTRAFSSVAV
jgi:hypothetical protein